jgi:DNA-binding PadR family transcriptional regulator
MQAVKREILLGLWKVHILHHAAEHPVVGLWMMRELREHGYEVSPGTLYPLLQRMVRHGWLRCRVASPGGSRARKSYFLTARGAAALALARAQVVELVRELGTSRRRSRAPARGRGAARGALPPRPGG